MLGSKMGFARNSMEPRHSNAPLVSTQATGLMVHGTKAEKTEKAMLASPVRSVCSGDSDS